MKPVQKCGLRAIAYVAVVASIVFIGISAVASETVETGALAGTQNHDAGTAPLADGRVAKPVVKDNIRYQPSQIDPGNLEGYDNKTNKLLWSVKIYNTSTTNPVHMRSISIEPDGTLLIENERGERFIFDMGNRYVSAI